MKKSVGKPVRDSNFFNRKRELRRMWRCLETDNVLLLAPRRVGKTSLMFRMEETAGEHGFQAVYFSVADDSSEISFIRKLYDAIGKLNSGPNILKKIGLFLTFQEKPDKISLGKLSVEFNESAWSKWADLGKAITRALDGLEEPWLLLVDEIPVFILTLLREDPTGERARTFLNWFRQLRQDHDNVSWLLAGSIGLDAVVARENMGDVINDLNLQRLGKFDSRTSHELLTVLAASYELTLSAPVKQHAIDRIHWTIPYFLQLVFAEILDLCDETETNKPSPDMVDQAFENLLSPAKKGYFDYWRQRLHEELGSPEDAMCIAMLTACARDAGGVRLQVLEQLMNRFINDVEERKIQTRYLLDVLENDGYIVFEDSRYIFRSPLLREFWVRRVAT